MSAMWKRLDALAGRAVSATFGEPVVLKPKIKSEYRAAAADPSRPEHTTRGVFSLEWGTEDLRGQRLRGEFASVGRIVNAAAYVEIMDADYSAIGYELRNGDHVTFPERGETYAVASVHPLDSGDRVIALTKEML